MRVIDLQLTIDGLVLHNNQSIDDFINSLGVVSNYPILGEVLYEDYMEDNMGSNSVFTTIGASNHSLVKREDADYYSTDVSAIDLLEEHNLLVDGNYWECACGDGRLSERLEYYGYNTVSSDLFDRGYGVSGVDFLDQDMSYENILTNPPFKFLTEFVLKGLELAEHRLYIFARLQTLESIGRYNKIFKDNPPRFVCPFVKRIPCYVGGGEKRDGSAIAYAWFIWDKQDPIERCEIKWLI